MRNLKNELQIIACDLSLVMTDWEEGNVDCMDNACSRVQSLIYELQELYPEMCRKADDKRYGRV